MSTSTRVATDRIRQFLQVRETTERLAARLTPEDQQLQSMPNCSPTKWHRVHTTWFFETFVLGPHAGSSPWDPRWGYLFNSYYEAVGARQPRPRRGLITRPDVAEVAEYRRIVDERLAAYLGLDCREGKCGQRCEHNSEVTQHENSPRATWLSQVS